jgi:hypothetical protein
VDESRRIAYLEQMGVPVWYATRPLEGALETPLSDPVLVSEYAGSEVETPNSIREFSAIGLPQDTSLPSISEPVSHTIKMDGKSLSLEPIGEAPIKTDASGSAPPAVKLNDSPQLHFSFAKIPLANGILLLAELGDENAPGFSAAETRLLTAITASLQSHPLSQQGLDSQLVKWPQLKGKGMRSDAQAAGDFLFAYLEAQRRRSNFDVLLLLGDSLKRALLGTPDSDGARLKELSVIAGCSLMKMLQQPSEKSVLWCDIKHLKN